MKKTYITQSVLIKAVRFLQNYLNGVYSTPTADNITTWKLYGSVRRYYEISDDFNQVPEDLTQSYVWWVRNKGIQLLEAFYHDQLEGSLITMSDLDKIIAADYSTFMQMMKIIVMSGVNATKWCADEAKKTYNQDTEKNRWYLYGWKFDMSLEPGSSYQLTQAVNNVNIKMHNQRWKKITSYSAGNLHVQFPNAPVYYDSERNVNYIKVYVNFKLALNGQYTIYSTERTQDHGIYDHSEPQMEWHIPVAEGINAWYVVNPTTWSGVIDVGAYTTMMDIPSQYRVANL